MSTYVYQALEGPEHIRLIALHPALSNDAPLRIDFVSSTLEDIEGRYDAISYTWGEPLLTYPLYTDGNGTQINVTRNLDRALRYLRDEHHDRLLWADAASINQVDNEEKAVQIPLMVRIFRGARRVMAWLDPGKDTIVEQRGMRTLDRLSRVSSNHKIASSMDFSDVLQFLALPWFNRLWIVQEVVFNAEVCLVCGKTELLFTRFMAALSFKESQDYLYRRYDIAFSGKDLTNWNAILAIKTLWNHHSLFNTYGSTETEIIELVEKFTSYGCTDPRDRIFALYSMATDVRPDANSPPSDDISSDEVSSYETSSDDSSSDDRSSRKYSSISRNRCRFQSPERDSSTSYSAPSYMFSKSETYMKIDYSLDVSGTYRAFTLAYLEAGGYSGRPILSALMDRQYTPCPADWLSWVPDWRVPVRKETPLPTYFDVVDNFNIRPVTENVINMRLRIDRDPQTSWNDNPYTIISKTSRKGSGFGLPFLSQLSQLHILLEGTKLRKPSSINLPKFLAQMVFKSPRSGPAKYVDPEYEEDIFQRLTEYFASVAMLPAVDDSWGSPKSSSVCIQDLIDRLDEDLDDFVELFCFYDPGLQVNSVGCGNTALELGDHILPTYRLGYHKGDHTSLALHLVEGIILRKAGSVGEMNSEDPDGGESVYRIVGSCYIFDPVDAMICNKKEEYEKLEEEVDESWRRWRKFLPTTGFQKCIHFVNLV